MRRHPALVVLVIAAALAAAAGRPAAQDVQALPNDPLFADEVVKRIDLRVNSADWEKLKQNFQENTYYPADFVFNGETVRNVGIRSRGFGSRSGTKPGLRVDFDRYAGEQSFLGLKSLVLDNLVQDASTVRETLSMKLYARLGVPAPREAHVRLYVNNAYAGLYAVVESVDKALLARVFGAVDGNVQNDGYLFEFKYLDPWWFEYFGDSLPAYARRFDPKTREKDSDHDKFAPLEELVRLANELPADRLVADLGPYLDLPAFMRYLAAQNFAAQDDGFLGYAGMNNFYLYRLEDSSRHVLIAWDEDNAFWGPEFELTRRHDENVLVRKAMQVPELRQTYFDTLHAAVRTANEPTGPDGMPWFEFEARRQLDLIFEPLREDPVKPVGMDAHQTGRMAVLIFVRNRAAYVERELAAAGFSR